MRYTQFLALVSALSLLATATHAADDEGLKKLDKASQQASLTSVPLQDVLDAVSSTSGKIFLIDARVQPTIVVGRLRVDDITFSTLLTVLRNNGLAAVNSGENTSIVPINTIRQYPLPTLFEDNEAIHDEEWVTRVIRLENTAATQMVPIMRPMLPQPGHLVAHADSNTLVLVGRYANTRRIAQLVEAMDTSVQAND